MHQDIFRRRHILEQIATRYKESDEEALESLALEPFLKMSNLVLVLLGTSHPVADFAKDFEQRSALYTPEFISERIEKFMEDPETRELAVQAIVYSIQYFIQNPWTDKKKSSLDSHESMLKKLNEVRPLEKIVLNVSMGFSLHNYRELALFLGIKAHDELEGKSDSYIRDLLEVYISSPLYLRSLDDRLVELSLITRDEFSTRYQDYIQDQMRYLRGFLENTPTS